jgi:LytS/YehU family sensor histidine kinase
MTVWEWDWRAYFFGCFVYVVPLSLWQAVLLSIGYFRRWKQGELDRARLEIAAKDAQFQALVAQLNPHFLFNSLNSLRGLILEDPARAQIMVTELASILRYSLQAGRIGTVTLAEEMEAVTNYLHLESIRLEERLRVRINVPDQLCEALLPPMVLQTLVENGVKHGVGPRPGGGELAVEASREGDAVRIEVRNSGQLAAAGSGTRIGLENARSRLKMLCGPAARLDLRNSDEDTVLAELWIPYASAAG